MTRELASYLLARAPGTPPLPRADLYRRLVRENISTVVENAFPVTRAILGADFGPALVDAFLAAGGPQTSYYREIPGDLVTWAIAAEEPLADLLHYEWMELVAARHPADVDAWQPGEDGLLRPNPTLQLAVYARPVHTMSAEHPAPPPYETPRGYLIWRRPRTDEVVFQRVGLVIARAIEHAVEAAAVRAPLSELALADVVAAEAGLNPAPTRAALAAACAELRQRHGL